MLTSAYVEGGNTRNPVVTDRKDRGEAAQKTLSLYRFLFDLDPNKTIVPKAPVKKGGGPGKGRKPYQKAKPGSAKLGVAIDPDEHFCKEVETRLSPTEEKLPPLAQQQPAPKGQQQTGQQQVPRGVKPTTSVRLTSAQKKDIIDRDLSICVTPVIESGPRPASIIQDLVRHCSDLNGSKYVKQIQSSGQSFLVLECKTQKRREQYLEKLREKDNVFRSGNRAYLLDIRKFRHLAEKESPVLYILSVVGEPWQNIATALAE